MNLPVVMPKTRGECAGIPRPCPFTQCRYHLQRQTPCVLDVADRGGQGQRAVAKLLRLSHARVQQIEVVALRKIAASMQEDV